MRENVIIGVELHLPAKAFGGKQVLSFMGGELSLCISDTMLIRIVCISIQYLLGSHSHSSYMLEFVTH